MDYPKPLLDYPIAPAAVCRLASSSPERPGSSTAEGRNPSGML